MATAGVGRTLKQTHVDILLQVRPSIYPCIPYQNISYQLIVHCLLGLSKVPMLSAASETGDKAVGALKPGTTMLSQSL